VGDARLEEIGNEIEELRAEKIMMTSPTPIKPR